MLLADAPLETACFLLAEPVRLSDSAWRLIVVDVMPLDPADYRARTPEFIELEAATLAAAAKRARLAHRALILAHTHPVSGAVAPSVVDRDGEARWVPAVRRRIGDLPVARLIVGRDAAHAALLAAEFEGGQPVRVIDLGRDVKIVADTADAPVDTASVHRQVLAFGSAGQRRIQRLRVGVVGCGGTGSVTVQQLAHLGVRDFLLVDPDVVEESNLNRLVGASSHDVGRPKVDVARDLVHGIHADADVDLIVGDVCDGAIARKLLTTDVFFCCTDSEGSRAVLNQLAYQFALPGFDMGVVIRVKDGAVTHVNGRVQMLAPGEPCLLCGDVLDAEQVRRELLTDEARERDQYIQGAVVPQPAVISINSATASLAVTMMLSAFTGMPGAARNQRIRFESGTVSRIAVDPQPACPVCSSTGAVRRGDSLAMPGRH